MKKLIIPFLLSLSFQSLADIYIVPTEEAHLKELAQFQITDAEITSETLSFTLPTELGSDQMRKVTFERSEIIPNTYTSTFGVAHCLQTESEQVKCNVKYNRIYKDFLTMLLPETESQLSQRLISAQELANRIDLARSFSSDPIGFLVIDL